MKRIILIFTLASTFLCLSCKSKFKEGEEKDFAKEVFETFKDNNYDSFHKLVITPEEFMNAMSTSTWSEKKKNMIKERLTKEFLDEQSKESFDDLQKEAKEYSIDFSKVKIDSTNTEVRVEDGLKELKFKLYFSNGTDAYKLRGSKILLTDHGWKLANGVSLSKVSKQF